MKTNKEIVKEWVKENLQNLHLQGTKENITEIDIEEQVYNARRLLDIEVINITVPPEAIQYIYQLSKLNMDVKLSAFEWQEIKKELKEAFWV